MEHSGSIPRCLASRFSVIPLPQVERLQEGDHSLVNRAANLRKVSGAYVSCALRQPEVDAIFESGSHRAPAPCPTDDSLQRFLTHTSAMTNPDCMAEKLGFTRHPQWKAALDEKAPRDRKLIIANRIVYSLHASDQFADVTAAGHKRKRTKAQEVTLVNLSLIHI